MRDNATVPATPRQGPRPLPLHLLTALQTWGSCELGLTPSNGGLPRSNPDPAAGQPSASPNPAASPDPTAIRLSPPAEAAADPAAFRAALRREILRRLDQLAAGVLAYRQHPAQRPLDDPPPIWHEGATCLRDVGAASGVSAAADAVPIVVAPSLINRWQVLDLAPGKSFVRALAAEGFRPLIVDWGTPGPAERDLDAAGCVERLARALDYVVATRGRPIPVLGYCMGGTLTVALAAIRPQSVSALAALAAPWDFHADRTGQGLLVSVGPALAEMARAAGELPIDLIQTLFYSLDPWLVVNKFLRFAAMDMTSDAARDFVLLEDWLNDGAPLPGQVAHDCLIGWYGDNLTGKGLWMVGGQPVRPRAIATPALVVIPGSDRIVPPLSAAGLVGQDGLPNARRLDLPLGHIGMMVGSSAAKRCWRPVVDWLRDRHLGHMAATSVQDASSRAQ
ncbi:alpha/beta fold hydrolase [Vineibacter terrae]|uniref:Alpha/beta fold hydrolase n=1 Tax=Vineibacter terrae TaxID=2586908 RepID=A0A5C8PLR5_9HYPH|nr:alpha/beta fold hydrolase [Vineibacter terrae]